MTRAIQLDPVVAAAAKRHLAYWARVYPIVDASPDLADAVREYARAFLLYQSARIDWQAQRDELANRNLVTTGQAFRDAEARVFALVDYSRAFYVVDDFVVQVQYREERTSRRGCLGTPQYVDLAPRSIPISRRPKDLED